MQIDLYYERCSPPCNSVIAVARALGVQLNLIYIDLDKGDNLTPEFRKLNPQCEIPTLVDDGFALWESRAICIYLVQKYGGIDATLLPVEPQQHAVVLQRLLFDQGTLYARLAAYFYPQVFFKAPADGAKWPKLLDAIGVFDTFLEGRRWAAGTAEHTLADITLALTIRTLVGSAGMDLSAHANVMRWYADAKRAIVAWEEVDRNMEEYDAYFADVRKQMK